MTGIDTNVLVRYIAQDDKQKSEFLFSIVGIGEAEEDLSERDEEILSEEIDPVRGWSLNSIENQRRAS